MKDKMRITLMVCTSAPGAKCPLVVIVKSRKPKCLYVSPPPLTYKDQKNACFGRNIFKWWIHCVFWPWHKKNQGNINALFLIDNYTAHKI